MIRILAAGCAVLALAGCSTIGAISGNTSDCASAQSQLNTEKTSLALAELGVSTASALGAGGPAVTAAQAAVNVINEDITSIQALVNSECVTATPATAESLIARAPAPVITLARAKTLVAADKKLAAAVAASRE